ncbi:exodeoxyribonuclease VII large subunit [Dietzia sp.]|uniref:exodeoxyribonuclease VII large subunit n=1 Tax=Dietzia sp. TaxID=1871616 RepID=UPI002FDB7605
MSNKSTAEEPFPVRVISQHISNYIARLGEVWIEGQIAQLNVRPGAKMAFIVLRDTSVDNSLQVTCFAGLLRMSEVAVEVGARVIVHGKFDYWQGRGSLSLRIDEIRPVGVGELLARLERLKKALAAEGLFAPERKRPLPFLPGCIGLITGRASAAEKDVVEVSRDRWPDVVFEIRNTAVQGVSAVPQVVAALEELDRDPRVEVIIVARGGGSVEDLLPFSDETLVRAISACRTPVVSAIGHEPDTPLSDLVADLRAATPTDAAKRVVPDVIAERARLAELRERSAAALRNWVERERRGLESVTSRPVLSQPHRLWQDYAEAIAEGRRRMRREVTDFVASQSSSLEHLSARLTTLGPAATLARGYAVVQRVAGPGDADVVSSIHDTPPGSQLRIRVTDGSINAAVLGVKASATASATEAAPAIAAEESSAEGATATNTASAAESGTEKE